MWRGGLKTKVEEPVDEPDETQVDYLPPARTMTWCGTRTLHGSHLDPHGLWQELCCIENNDDFIHSGSL